MNRRFLLLMIVYLSLSGCAGQWIKVSAENQSHKTDRYQFELPETWVKRVQNDTLIVSKDGPDLQKIAIRAASHDNAFKHLEKASSLKMLTSELSAMFVADLKKESKDGLPSLVVETDEPATIGDKEGFKIVARYSTDSGVRYRLIAYGLATDTGFFVISYTAPEIHYFERDRAEFEKAFSSLALL